MATIRRRNGKWQVQVRILGATPISRTFIRKQDADRWGLEIEAQIQRGDLGEGIDAVRRMTLKDLLERYRDTVTAHKRGKQNETYMIELLLREPFVRNHLPAVTAKTISSYRDKRMKEVLGSTVNRELTLLSHIYKIARTEWDIPVKSPLAGVRRAKNSDPRQRRLEEGEWDTLMEQLKKTRNKLVGPVIRFSVETGMRRGEILGSQWADVDWERRTLHIPKTKTGNPRTIPLSPVAYAILEDQRAQKLDRPFPLTTEAFKLAWKRLIRRAQLDDLNFHDMRHEAISRLFEKGLTIPEVALISGHKDYRMLARYTHLRPEAVGSKLWSDETKQSSSPSERVSETCQTTSRNAETRTAFEPV